MTRLLGLCAVTVGVDASLVPFLWVGQGAVLRPASQTGLQTWPRSGLSSERKGLRLRRRGRCALPPAGFVSDLPCVRSSARAWGHRPAVQPALSGLCSGGPVAPACTWRASVAAPSPGRWEGCVAQEQMSGVFQATHPSPCLSPRGASGTLAGRRTAAEGSFPHGPSSACHPEALGSCYQARLQGHLGWHRRSTAGGHGLGMRCSLAQGGPARVGVSSGCGAQLSSFLVLGVLLVSSRIGMSRVETSVSGRDRCRRSGEAHQGP